MIPGRPWRPSRSVGAHTRRPLWPPPGGDAGPPVSQRDRDVAFDPRDDEVERCDPVALGVRSQVLEDLAEPAPVRPHEPVRAGGDTRPDTLGRGRNVFEDVDFAGVATDWDTGVSDVAQPNVDVELYTSADAYVASAATNGSASQRRWTRPMARFQAK